MPFREDRSSVRLGNLSQAHPPFGAAMSHAAVKQNQLIGRCIHRPRGDPQNLFSCLFSGFVRRSAMDTGAAAAAHSRVLEHLGGIEHLHFN